MFWLLPKSIFAQGVAWTGRCVGKGEFAGVATIQGFECLFANILSVVTAFAGLVSFAMFIVGGFQYLSSEGDQKALASANSTLTNALLGLVGIVVSGVILQLISNFTGVNAIKTFSIPGSP